MRTLFMLGVTALALSAQSVNYSGKWLIELPAGRATRPSVITLNQVGTEVEGTIGARYSDSDGSPVHRDILAGKVENGVLSFYTWTGRDRPSKIHFKGTMVGETINFTITRPAAQPGSPAQPETQNVTAKRTK